MLPLFRVFSWHVSESSHVGLPAKLNNFDQFPLLTSFIQINDYTHRFDYHLSYTSRLDLTTMSRGLAANITVDDFDPLVGYSNYADWYTPDPSQNPTWYSASRDVTKLPWHEGKLDLVHP